MITTKKDFTLFKKYGKEYEAILGLSDWAVFYEHVKLKRDFYAETYWDTENHTARITLSIGWDNLRNKTDVELKRLALHEVLHVMLCSLVSEASNRYTTQERIDTEEHRIVRMLERFVQT